MVLHNQIAKPPADSEFIDDVLARQLTGLDNDFIEAIGSPAKGLPAIEYLIFAPDGDNDAALARLTSNPSRMEYLVSATQNLHNKAQEVQAYWLAEGNDYANNFINADGEGRRLTVRSVCSITKWWPFWKSPFATNWDGR